MGKLKLNEKGFTPLETVLLVVIVAALVLVGYYVYHTNKSANDTLNKASQASSSHASYKKSSVTNANATATAQANTIQSALEAYYTANGYYPGSLATSPLLSLNVSGLSADTFKAPIGTKFVYTPTPNGCTTLAKTCKHYTLTAEEEVGKVITTIKSSH